MRFLTVDAHDNLIFTQYWTNRLPEYAILSHTWGTDEEEVTFQDIQSKLATNKPAGYAKLQFCAAQAQKDGLKYFWVDTCCINKADLTELDEAIRSMFRWYKNAGKCYVYLPNISTDDLHCNHTPPLWESAFRNSRWFTRGWTLQELLAPESVEFFAREGHRLGTKKDLEQQIHEITGIPITALRGKPLETFSVEERFRWAEGRETRRVEDNAYCLCGIFNVDLRVKYGEKEEAFERLKKKIGVTIWQLDSHIQQAYSPKRLEVERLSGKPLPLECCFINLCILHHIRDADSCSDKDMNESKLSPFSLPARLKVETPPKSRQVPLEALFNVRKRKDGTPFRPSRILIWGRAGMGKTTLCKKMVYEFYHNDLWRDLYDRIIWLPLRRLKLMGNELYGIVDLIRKELFPNRHENRLAENIEKMVIQSNRTLFILDGLDEVSHAFDRDSSIGRVLESLLALPSVIITSRPHSTNVFDHEQLDLELETIGFLPKQIDQYLRRITTQTNMQEKRLSEIQSFIQSRPLVQSLVRIPIQLDAICYVWSDRRFPKDNITMTTLYQAISRRVWEKDIVRLGKSFDGKAITKQQLEGCPNTEVFIKPEIGFLQELAFHGLHNGIIEFDTEIIENMQIEHQILSSSPVHLSFLRSSDNSLEPSDRTLHFIHLTFQEYFAAKHFVQHWISGKDLSLQVANSRNRSFTRNTEPTSPQSFLKLGKYVDRYDIFWRFVVGLLHAEANQCHLYQFLGLLEQIPVDLIGLTHQRLVIHCLSEVTSPDSEGQLKVRKLEDNYLQWIFCEFKSNLRLSETSLMREAECPDHIFQVLLKSHENVVKDVMKMLRRRPSLSTAILDAILQTLKKSTNEAVRAAAIQILGEKCGESQKETFDSWHIAQLSSQTGRREVTSAWIHTTKLAQPAVDFVVSWLRDPAEHVRATAANALGGQTTLADSTVEALVPLLRDPANYVRAAAANALGGQTTLADSAVEALVPLLRDPIKHVGDMAAYALGGQTTLPESAIELLVSMLKDPVAYVRSYAAHQLGNHEEFFSHLPALDQARLQGLLENWLWRQSVTCFVWNNHILVDINGTSRKIPLENERQVLFKSTWLKARDELRLPKLDPVLTSIKPTRAKRKRLHSD